MDLIEQFKQQQVKEIDRPQLRTGDIVRMHTRVEEGKKTRTQVFEGTVLALRGSGPSRMVTVRRSWGGFSVERIFPVFSPLIEKIEVIRRQKVRRAKLTYLREERRRKVKEFTKGPEEASAPTETAEETTPTEAVEPAETTPQAQEQAK